MTIPELIQLGHKAKAANDRFRQDERKLYDRRGFPRFPREEHDERVKDLKAERNEVLREVEERANEILAWAEQEAERALQFTPDVLDSADRRQVTERLPFIEADIASLAEDELVARLEGVLRGDSKTDKAGYAMLAKKRRKEIIEQRTAALARTQQGGDRTPSGAPSSSVGARITLLDGIVKKLEEATLGPEAKLKAARYSEVAREASKISTKAFVNARDADSYAGVLAQNYSAHEFAERQRREPLAPSITRGAHGSLKGVNTR